MVTLTFSDELAQQLQRLAAREGRSVEEVVRDMVQQYAPIQESKLADDDETPSPDPLIGLIGLLDEFTDATDLSSR